MKGKSLNKKLMAISICVLLVCGIIVAATTYRVYAHYSDYKLKYVLADQYETEDTFTVMFDGNSKTITVPEYSYYEFEPEYYCGRILHAAIVDQTTGFMMVKYIEDPEPADTPASVSPCFSDANSVLEIHYYDEEEATLFCIYIDCTAALEGYISQRFIANPSDDMLNPLEGSQGYYLNFLSKEPEIFDVEGKRIDAYPQSYHKGILSLAAANDPNIPADCSPGKYDKYTDSDNYVNDPSKTLSDYQYGSNFGNITNNKRTYNDDIVQFIPMELFRQRGDYLYIGREYGFFVSTYMHTDRPGNCNTVEVGIFDINYRDEQPINNGAEIETSVELRFLFHHSYSYITRESVGEEEWLQFYDESQTEIIAFSRFEGWEEYYVHNVSFGAMIFDELKLNPGQSGYDENNDNAAHIIQGRYNFYGSSLKSGDPAKTGIATAKFTLGALGKVPGKVGAFAKVGWTIWNFIDLVRNNPLPFETSFNDVKMSNEMNIKTPDPNKKSCRAFAATLTYPQDSNVALLRPGQHAQMIYMLGNYNYSWTRIYHTMNIFVSRLDKGALGTSRDLKYFADGGSTYYRHLENRTAPETPISPHEEKSANILSGGWNRFAFTPAYTGDYTINCTSMKDIKLIVRNSVKQEISTYTGASYFTHRFEGDGITKYYLDIFLQDPEETDFFYITIDLKLLPLDTDDSLRTMPAHSNWAVGFSPKATETYQITSANANLKLRVISPTGSVDFVAGAPMAFYRFNANVHYMIVALNETAAPNDLQLSVSNLLELTLSSTLNFDAYPGITYFSYTNDTNETQYVVFSVDGIQNYDHDWEVKNDAWQTGQATVFTGAGVAKINVLPNTKMYVGLKNNSVSVPNVAIQSTLQSNAYSWYINGNRIDDNTLSLKRGSTANVSFQAGNVTVSAFVYQGNESFEVNGKNTVRIKENAMLGTTEQLYANTITDYPLNIKPLYEQNFSYEIVNSENLYMKWGSFKGLSKVCFTITAPNGNSYQIETNDLYGRTSGRYNIIYQSGSDLYCYESLVKSRLGYDKWGECGIHINWIEIEQRDINLHNPAWKYRIYNYSAELSVADQTFDPMFGGGNGYSGTPHIITGTRHLNNIRYRKSQIYNGSYYENIIEGCYRIEEGFGLPNQDWTPISLPFRGTIEGNQNTIYGLKITIPSYAFGENQFRRYGLFERLNGVINDLTLQNINIYGAEQHGAGNVTVGAFAGDLTGGRLDNCSARGTIKVLRRYSYVGGLTGFASGFARLTSSTNEAKITGNGELGGLAGVLSNSTVDGGVNYGTIEYSCVAVDNGFNNAGGIVGRAYSSTIQNSFNFGAVEYTRERWEGNTELAPCMGQIAGYMQNGSTQTTNQASGYLRTGSLYTFTTGSLWWKKTHNQARNCNTYVGLTA